MKTYKLIKDYPGAVMPMEVTEKNNWQYGCVDNLLEFTKTIVENNPEFWQEIKREPLFVTDDDVELFNENDIIYSVDKFPTSISVIIEIIPAYHTFLNRKYFSTKKLAQDYLDKYIPIFSIEQVLNAYEKSMDCRESYAAFKNELGIKD